MRTRAQSYRKYLDPNVLRRIGSLELRARLIVEGFFSGMHSSPHRGLSIEFADYRPYTQGDDLRHIDWKVFARTNKYYVKQYEQETNLNLVLLVDCSESMEYRSRADLFTKHEYATSIAAAIAYLALQQQDSVGLATFDEELTRFIRASSNPHHWKTIIKELEGKTGAKKTSVGRVLEQLAERLPHRTLVIIVSDLFDEVSVILKGLERLRYRGHEMVVCNVWDPAELSLPFSGPTMFEGLEDAGTLLTDPRSLRERYLEEVEHFRGLLSTGCSHMHVDYTVFDTSAPLDVALSAYLATRSARIRQRSSRVLGRG